MFLDFLYRLRAQGVPVATTEWLVFLDALRRGLATDLGELYRVGRAVLCRSEADYDAFDQAFAASFDVQDLPLDLRQKLGSWLAEAAAQRVDTPALDERRSVDDLWREFLQRLAEQTERHDGGSYWIGTGGTSPFGHSGRGQGGVRIGGERGGGGAVAVAAERHWASYRQDRALDVRDFEVALRALRALKREGALEFDLEATIDRTSKNAGDIEVVERPARKNQVHLVLMLDSGGSMEPHAARVERLFSAAARVRTFRSLNTYLFHNCVDERVVRYGDHEPVLTSHLLDGLGPHHRVLFVGDASMAPYELFGVSTWGRAERTSGINWLRLIRRRVPSSAWLNPDPARWWSHPTVDAIGTIFPMFELTLDGLRGAVRSLRAPT